MELTQPTPIDTHTHTHTHTLLGMSVPNVINPLNKMGGVRGVYVCFVVGKVSLVVDASIISLTRLTFYFSFLHFIFLFSRPFQSSPVQSSPAARVMTHCCSFFFVLCALSRLISKCFLGPTLFVASFLSSQLMHARPTDGQTDRPTGRASKQSIRAKLLLP